VTLTELSVLLLSPFPELDPPGCDVTYTEKLLESTPPSVVYETYAQALADGSLAKLGRRNSLNGALRRRFPAGLAMIGPEPAIYALRSRDLLSREPFRYVDIKSSGYDLAHDHVYRIVFPSRCCAICALRQRCRTAEPRPRRTSLDARENEVCCGT